MTAKRGRPKSSGGAVIFAWLALQQARTDLAVTPRQQRTPEWIAGQLEASRRLIEAAAVDAGPMKASAMLARADSYFRDMHKAGSITAYDLAAPALGISVRALRARIARGVELGIIPPEALELSKRSVQRKRKDGKKRLTE